MCILPPLDCIRICVKAFILLAEIQKKNQKKKNGRKNTIFRLACISTLRLKVGRGLWKSFWLSTVTLWGRVCLVKYSWVSVR